MTALDWAGAAYPLVGMIAFLWIMGPIGMWESPSFRIAIWFMPDPRKVPDLVTPVVALRMLPGMFAMVLWVFANFLIWPVAVLGSLGWIGYKKLAH